LSKDDLHLYYHTIRYLRPKQVLFRLYYLIRRSWRRIKGFRYPAFLSCADLSLAAPALSLVPFIPTRISLQDKSFNFLNRTKNFPDKIDWNCEEFGKLWLYNLNYFDYLLQPGMKRDNGLALIRSFVEHAGEEGAGYEPYPISLRGVNWIKFLSLHDIGDRLKDAPDGGHTVSTTVTVNAAAIHASLYAQYRRLLDNIEYHLMGNHLLENGFSLLFGGAYFGDARLYRKAEEILREELDEQILSDGGHYERSPMYHQIILGRVLDGINLLKNNVMRSPSNLGGHAADAFRPFDELRAGLAKGDNKLQNLPSLLALLEEKAARMLGWLCPMTYRDGSIPLVNDATYGIAPTSRDLFAYAASLGINPLEAPLGESGYRKIAGDDYEAVLDVGAIGPDYIPGHAHADTLGFELRVGGSPVIVDTGTSTYEDNDLRHWQRSTRAHNTVEIDGESQSEVWGSFRVAKRARVTKLRESGDRIEVTHDGYGRLSGKPLHTRLWQFRADGLQIRDRIDGDFREAVSRFYFHPEVRLMPSRESAAAGRILLPAGREVRWQIEKGRGSLTNTSHHPEFNINLPNRCLEVYFDGPEACVEFVW